MRIILRILVLVAALASLGAQHIGIRLPTYPADGSASGAETCEDWTMRDFEETATEYFTVADPWVRGDVDFAYAGWLILEVAPGAGNYDVIVDQWAGGQLGFTSYVQPSNVGCPNCMQFSIGAGGDGRCGTDAFTHGALSASTLYFFQMYFDDSDGANGSCNISINNGAVDSVAASGALADSTAAFSIGARPAIFPADARMGPIMRFTTLPDAAEWTALYNEGFRLSCADAAAALSVGVMSHCWPLDEDSGNALESDTTGNNVDLTDTNDVGSATACIP